MTTTTDIGPDVFAHGYVVGRYVTAMADRADEDRYLDLEPATGVVTFTPTIEIRTAGEDLSAQIVQQPVTCTLDGSGNLVDGNGLPGVFLPVGVYDVDLRIPGLDVTGRPRVAVMAHHTVDAPLNLVAAIEQIVPASAVILIDDSTAQRAEAAALRAEGSAGNVAAAATLVPRIDLLEATAFPDPESPTDGQTAALVGQADTLTSTAIGGRVESITATRSLETFGATGDGTTDDAAALTSALTWATGRPGRRLVGSPSAAYAVNSTVTIPAGPIYMDLAGAEIRFENGGKFYTTTPKPFLTTTSTAGIKRKGTNVVCGDVTGVAPGDLMQVEAAELKWGGTASTLKHTYRVADVDLTTNTVWFEGRAVGDVSAEQIAAAGKTSTVVVRFYKTRPALTLANCTLTSPLRTGADQLVRITGYDRVRLDNVTVHQPNRTGVQVEYCAEVDYVGYRSGRHGYNRQDDRSEANASSPGGLGFGYGYVTTNTWMARTSHCVSTSGWRGWDFAAGTSYALVSDHTSSKDGLSTHEGCTVLDVQGGRFLGGTAIGSQSAEVYLRGVRFDTSLGLAFNSHGMAHRVVIQDCDIDCGEVDGKAAPFGVSATNGYGAWMFTMSEKPALRILDTDIRGITWSSMLQGRGDVTLARVHLTVPDGTTVDTSINCKALATGATLTLDDVTAVNSGAAWPVVATNYEQVIIKNSTYRGVPGYSTNSGILAIPQSSGPVAVEVHNSVSRGAVSLVNVRSTDVTVEVFGSTAFSGDLVSALSAVASSVVVKAAVHNRFKGKIGPTGSTVALDSGNVVIPA